MKLKKVFVLVYFLLLFITNGSCESGSAVFSGDEDDTIVIESSVSTDADYDLTCGETFTTFRLSNSLVSSFKFNVSVLFFVDDTLNPFKDGACYPKHEDEEGFTFEMNEFFGQCAADIEEEGEGKYRVTFIVCVSPELPRVISRFEVVYLYFSCVYDRKVVETLGRFKPFIKPEKIFKEPNRDEIADVYLPLNRYTDSSFTVLDTTMTAFDEEDVFLETCIDATDQRDIVLQGLECRITPFDKIFTIPYVPIIEYGCPVEDVLPGGRNVIYENFNTTCFRFSFTSFHWIFPQPIEEQKLFIFCRINVCDLGGYERCTKRELSCQSDHSPLLPPTPAPPNRKRRGIDDLMHLKTNEQVVAYGQIEVKQLNTKFKTCDEAAMGCDFACAVLNDETATCVCPVGQVLGADEKSCLEYISAESQTGEIKTLSMTQLLNDAIAITIMIASIFALISYCREKKKQRSKAEVQV